MKKALWLFMASIILCLFGCNKIEYTYSDVTFSLNADEEGIISPDVISNISLISNEEEFSEYLSSKNFDEVFSAEFIAENRKYDSDFFLAFDLIAIIYHATSGSIEDVKLESVRLESDDSIRVSLRTVPGSNIGTSDMAEYFTFYVVVKKIESPVNGISYEVK